MEAAVAVIINEQKKVLCVSPKYKPDKFGLIGGKIEDGETPKNAVVREVEEETGLEVLDCKYLYTHDCAGFDTFCFVVPMYSWMGEPKNTEGCTLKWMAFEELLSCTAFPDYNKKTLELLKKGKFL